MRISVLTQGQSQARRQELLPLLTPHYCIIQCLCERTSKLRKAKASFPCNVGALLLI